MGQAVNLIGHIANTTVEKYPVIADYTEDLGTGIYLYDSDYY